MKVYEVFDGVVVDVDIVGWLGCFVFNVWLICY